MATTTRFKHVRLEIRARGPRRPPLVDAAVSGARADAHRDRDGAGLPGNDHCTGFLNTNYHELFINFSDSKII